MHMSANLWIIFLVLVVHLFSASDSVIQLFGQPNPTRKWPDQTSGINMSLTFHFLQVIKNPHASGSWTTLSDKIWFSNYLWFIVDRVLREANVKKWLAKSRLKLKPDYIAKRLKWALAHKDWTAEDFEKVIWSDECSVEKSKDPRQQWVFREPGEQWLADCVHPKEKDKGISLVVWGYFWGKRKGSLVPIT